jgi:hypothetical protein
MKTEILQGKIVICEEFLRKMEVTAIFFTEIAEILMEKGVFAKVFH